MAGTLSVPLNGAPAPEAGVSPSLFVVLVLTTLGSAALGALAGMALYRRRSLPYFLVTVAIGTLLLRSLLGIGTLGGVTSMATHHLLEHLLDAVVIGLLFAAVYVARSADARRDSGSEAEYR
jgi:ABC-type branched-subunit amino acid transport system permease subunit